MKKMNSKYIISYDVALFSTVYFFKHHFPLSSISAID